MSTYKELQQQIANLQEEASKILNSEREAAIASIKDQMKTLGITISDLNYGKKEGKNKSQAAAKYRDPESQKTWSGRGRKPLWMTKSAEEYLIK